MLIYRSSKSACIATQEAISKKAFHLQMRNRLRLSVSVCMYGTEAIRVEALCTEALSLSAASLPRHHREGDSPATAAYS
jgi:hypothetical protein